MREKRFITCDGNYAAAHIAYMFSEVAAIYQSRRHKRCSSVPGLARSPGGGRGNPL